MGGGRRATAQRLEPRLNGLKSHGLKGRGSKSYGLKAYGLKGHVNGDSEGCLP